jgi:probable addiction module antidote protein
MTIAVPIKLRKFDPARYLDNEEVIAEYLTAALEDENPEVFLEAIGNVARVRGIADIAKRTGLGRESLYKALAPGAKPRYDTILRVLRSLDVKIRVTP